MITKKYQIFVSSTFEDLKEERRAVTAAILDFGHIPVGMEGFQASNEDQWTYITRRLKEVDYYVVLVAERYGSTDPTTGWSYTEKEYRFAVDNHIPVAAFLLSSVGRKKWPSGSVEYDKMQKIEDFRALCSQKMSKEWNNADELALRVQSALNELFQAVPRPGLVPSSEIPGPEVLAEMARLSEGNYALKNELSAMRQQVEGSQLTPKEYEAFQSLRAITLRQIFRHLINGNAIELSAATMTSVFRRKISLAVDAWSSNGNNNIHQLGETLLLQGFIRMGLLHGARVEREIHRPFRETQRRTESVYHFSSFGLSILTKTASFNDLLLGGGERN